MRRAREGEKRHLQTKHTVLRSASIVPAGSFPKCDSTCHNMHLLLISMNNGSVVALTICQMNM